MEYNVLNQMHDTQHSVECHVRIAECSLRTVKQVKSHFPHDLFVFIYCCVDGFSGHLQKTINTPFLTCVDSIGRHIPNFFRILTDGAI
ncbi:hypothetical protein DTO96_100706 [Ephemeroptericola cinctiostellae]|uniref:Uncharacterized protein n=1 Tax=Ephemeroptericola cinctiostellae TaxID=2268024 RepID=A0A345D9F1_9BURK|nr:hypothetical protein DTO96_100706 [Ephemeroptericola cinctiostellae]